MTLAWDGADASSVLIAFTPLRRVGPRECPYRGLLVRAAAGVHVVLDPEEVPASELFWTPRDDAHVLRAWDAVHSGSSAGHGGPSALVEACRERLDAWIATRAASGGVAPGECVTIAVALLRGIRELREAGEADARGQWWLTASARPVFALTSGGEDASTLATQILRLLGDALRSDTETGRALLAAADALLTEISRGEDLEECEAALFRWAQPLPLRPGARAPSVAPAGPRSMSWTQATSAPPDQERGSATPFDALLGSADVGWQRVWQESAGSLRELAGRWRSSREQRSAEPVGTAPAVRTRGRRFVPVLVFVAVVMLGVPGALLVLDAGPAASDRIVPPAPSPSLSVTTSADVEALGADEQPIDPAGGEEADDAAALESHAATLVDAAVTCGEDLACLTTVAERPDLALPEGAVRAPRADRTWTFLDLYGDIAVIQVDAPDSASQLVVLSRHGGQWLLREVMDLAQQP